MVPGCSVNLVGGDPVRPLVKGVRAIPVWESVLLPQRHQRSRKPVRTADAPGCRSLGALSFGPERRRGGSRVAETVRPLTPGVARESGTVPQSTLAASRGV